MATNKVLQYAIKAMLEEGKPYSEIAEITSLSEKTIKKYDKIFFPEKNKKVNQDETTPKRNRTKLFINRTAAKNNKGVSIMTEAESGRGESVRKRMVTKKRANIPVHKIYDEE